MPEPDDHTPHPRRWHALAVSLVVGFMSLLDVTIVNVAIPSIQEGLDASPESVQWVVSGYALTFGLVLVAGGRLGDLVGRRRMFLIGLVAFTLTSAVAGMAPTDETLVAARLLQGVAAGILTPQNSGLIQQLFRGDERGRAFGWFGATVSVSAATGPVLGGALIALFGPDLGWRAVFLVNVPIGLVAMVLAARLIPSTGQRRGRLRDEVDGVGALLLGVAVLGVLFPIVRAMSAPATPLWAAVAVAPVATWLFVRWERHVVGRGRAPLLDVRLLRQAPGFTTGIALQTVYFAGFSGLWLVLALFFQDGLGYTALESGLAVTPFALGSAVSAVLAGRLVGRWGRRVTVTGLLLVLAGFARPDAGRRGGHLHRARHGVPAARRRGRVRCGDLTEHDHDAQSRPAADGRCRRWCHPDRCPGRQRDRCRRARRGLPDHPGGRRPGRRRAGRLRVRDRLVLVALALAWYELRRHGSRWTEPAEAVSVDR